MIVFFPNPYPDELLYSLIARFSDRVQYPDKKCVVRELFGNSNALAIIDLPTHLGSLVSALPVGLGYTVNCLIDDHTLLPFYSPFHPQTRINRLRSDLQKARICAPGRLGIMANTIPTPL